MRYVLAWGCVFVTIMLVIQCTDSRADDWTTADTVRTGIGVGLTVVDCLQTHTIANNPQQWSEKNPLLGEHPSVGRVNALCALGIAAQIGGAYVLPKPYREIFQYIVIGVEASAVHHNYSIGIHTSW